MKREIKTLLLFLGLFLVIYYLPVGNKRFDNAIFEALELSKWYAREHVLLCLVPSFFIAGAISVFIRQETVLRYLGTSSNKILAYSVASVSGAILAVCSCTVLPLFAGLYHQGAGIGPATTFLYSGPAINVLALILSAKVLGIEIGIGRGILAVTFSILIGIIMHLLYKKSDVVRINNIPVSNQNSNSNSRNLLQEIIYFATMVGILVFANWGKPNETEGIFYYIFVNKWVITSVFAVILGIILIVRFKVRWIYVLGSAVLVAMAYLTLHNITLSFSVGVICLVLILLRGNEEQRNWLSSTWDFTKQIIPLLFFGVLIAGFALGRPGKEGIIPSEWVASVVSGNSIFANLFASVVGAFMYFATLTEVPIVQGLLGSGMGKGPALALLLSGPALSLPNMLVINKILGPKKTITYILLVIVFSTIAGYIFGLVV